MAWSGRPGLPAFMIGCLTLGDLVAGRFLLRADEARVYLAGRALDYRCAFHEATGLYCPTCGMTRSVVMSLHGEWARAWHMSPGGPVLVASLGIFALVAIVWGAFRPIAHQAPYSRHVVPVLTVRPCGQAGPALHSNMRT